MSGQENGDTLRTKSAPNDNDGEDFLASATWSSESLQSRLYSDVSASKLVAAQGTIGKTGTKSMGSFVGGQTSKNNAKTGRVLNSRMLGSQSTPALRTLSNGKILERKSTKKTQSIVSKNSRQLLSKPIISPSKDTLGQSSALYRKNEQDSKTDDQSSAVVMSNNDGEDEGKDIPRTFLESLNLSAKHQHELFHVPHTFFYLSKENVNTRAYDLKLIPQEAIDKNQYYTISKEGLTLHRGSDSEFTSLAQWEREYSLFHQISVIRFFRQYRRWKVNTTSNDKIYLSAV